MILSCNSSATYTFTLNRLGRIYSRLIEFIEQDFVKILNLLRGRYNRLRAVYRAF